ncbi:MAG: hypothetical protein K6G27_13975 [Lachnospiraceae bacterium]|nr:hypothetical protein [Lachnospiraceae bacterium]
MKQDLSMRQGLSGILMGILMDILIKQASLAVILPLSSTLAMSCRFQHAIDGI